MSNSLSSWSSVGEAPVVAIRFWSDFVKDPKKLSLYSVHKHDYYILLYT